MSLFAVKLIAELSAPMFPTPADRIICSPLIFDLLTPLIIDFSDVKNTFLDA